MILYLIRHAIAEPAGAAGEVDDSRRPLTDKGRKKMRRIARGLRELEVRIDLILTSPYLRTTQTARILAKTFDLAKEDVVSTGHLAPPGDIDRLVDEINRDHAGVENLALVGHAPSLGSLASMLLAGDPSIPLNLKKGGVCRLSLEELKYARCAALDWLLSPAQLAEIGG